MPRELNTELLNDAARHYAAEFLRKGRKNRPEGRWVQGREYVIQDLQNLTYKDVFDYIVPKIRGHLGPDAVAEFDAEVSKFPPRTDEVFRQLLADNLAIDPDGNHVKGKVGKLEIGRRVVGVHRTRFGAVRDATWPIYAGEEEERAAGAGPDVVDPLPAAGSTFFDNEHLK